VLEYWSKGVMVWSIHRESPHRAAKIGHRPSMIAAFLRCSPSAISKIIAQPLSKGCSTNSLPSVLLVKTPISEAEED